MFRNSNLRIVAPPMNTTIPKVVINDVEFYYSLWEFYAIDIFIANSDTSLLYLNVNSHYGNSTLTNFNCTVNIHNCTLGYWRIESIGDVQITDCSIVENPPYTSNKLIYIINSSAVLERILIQNFDCPMFPFMELCGVVVHLFSKVQINNSIFKGNKNSSISVTDGSHLLMKNCTVIDNDVLAGVICGWTSTVNITNCTFKSNTGSMSMIQNSTITVNHSTFIDNHSWDSAGGVCVQTKSTLIISNCIFTNNSADKMGGAVTVMLDSKLTIIKSTFNGNTAPEIGGAIFIDGNCSFVCTNSSFNDNRATLRGSAIAIQTSNATLSNLMLNQNHGEGVLYIYEAYFADVHNCMFYKNKGGALQVHTMTKLEVRNSHFFQNKAGSGGAIVVYFLENVTLSHVRIFQNVARYGGAIEIGPAKMYIDNCLINDNVAVYDGGAIFIPGGSGD